MDWRPCGIADVGFSRFASVSRVASAGRFAYVSGLDGREFLVGGEEDGVGVLAGF